MAKDIFERDFLLGAATAAHQVEGNNRYSDFWAMEQLPHTMYAEPSLAAADHYRRYAEDIELMARAGMNAYRFSLEWARIEPEAGRFEAAEIEHYRQVIACCKANKIIPLVTLHHFSSPKWLICAGGWADEAVVDYFGRYVEQVMTQLGREMGYICTINEANMGLQIGKMMQNRRARGAAPAGVNKKAAAVQVGLNNNWEAQMGRYAAEAGEAFGMDFKDIHQFLEPKTAESDLLVIKCHVRAREIIRRLAPHCQVGITFSLYDHQALAGGEARVRKEQEEDFLHYLPYLAEDDFIGVQNYSRKRHNRDGAVLPAETARFTKMNYEFYPWALAGVIRFVAEHWNKAIIVTENGISTDDDGERREFITEALAGVKACLDDGIDVRGYMHWSLLDNFEWQLGYAQTFGLIAVDRATQTRAPKESLAYLGAYRKKD